MATNIYNKLPGATVAADIMTRPLHSAYWISTGKHLFPLAKPLLSKEQVFSCIAMLESGMYNLPPNDLKDVMAISARNLLYVSKALLCDPYDAAHLDDIKLVLGNVGRNGMVLMVAPLAPQVRSSGMEHWEHVKHEPFMFHGDNCFTSTSLHLSFTGYELPLRIGAHGHIDHDVVIVETVISVHDRGKWVGDIDVLALYEQKNILLRRFKQDVGCCHADRLYRQEKLTSMDNWEELLDVPEDMGRGNIGIVRAHDNWQARQASACISIQKGLQTVILPPQSVCWRCCCTTDWQWVPPTPRSISPSEDRKLIKLHDTKPVAGENLDNSSDEPGDSDESDSSSGSDSSTITIVPFEAPDVSALVWEHDSITRLHTQVMIY
ncbi:hypothetical protein MMC18_008718 [Xylographa bjoerkii]|nr:hypothetical protein [Xylographa bjoerkii]